MCQEDRSMKNFKIYFLILFFSIGALEVNAGGGHNHGGAETLLPLNLRGEARSSLYQFTVVYQEILNGSEGHSAEEGHDDHDDHADGTHTEGDDDHDDHADGTHTEGDDDHDDHADGTHTEGHDDNECLAGDTHKDGHDDHADGAHKEGHDDHEDDAHDDGHDDHHAGDTNNRYGLLLYVEDFATAEPIEDARVKIAFGSTVRVFSEIGSGIYVLRNVDNLKCQIDISYAIANKSLAPLTININ